VSDSAAMTRYPVASRADSPVAAPSPMSRVTPVPSPSGSDCAAQYPPELLPPRSADLCSSPSISSRVESSPATLTGTTKSLPTRDLS
jgi:hypothetical protein